MTDDAPTAEATKPPELPKCPLCRAHGQATQRASASRAGCSNKKCGLHVQAKTLDDAVAGWAAICDAVTPIWLLREINKQWIGQKSKFKSDSESAAAVDKYVQSIGQNDVPKTDS